MDALQELAAELRIDRGLGAALVGITEAATTTVPGCDAASVAISLEGRPATAAVSARIALELDLLQYDTGEGPCLASLKTHEALRLDLVEQGDRFPHFAMGAAALGVVAVLSTPAISAGQVIGTLNLYSRSRPFDESSVAVAAILAAQVAIAIVSSAEVDSARIAVDRAQRYADEMAEISTAQGLLIGSEACTAEQADGLLRNAAIRDAVQVGDIARRIIEEHRRQI